MIMGHIICKINHFIRIRCQNPVWRPREPHCASCISLKSSKFWKITSKLGISQISKSLIFFTISYFVKQIFLRQLTMMKFARLQYFGDTKHFRGLWSNYVWPPLIFEHFSKSHIFDILDFSRELTIGPNDLGGTWESFSWLDLSIPRLDIAPTHAGNRRFCVKNRDFSIFEQNSHIWSRINKIELHQQNSILLM